MNPPSLITKEQKAHQLWGKFSRRNQEAFWNDYEKLIPQNKPYQLTQKPAKDPTSMSTPEPKRLVVRYPVENLLPIFLGSSMVSLMVIMVPNFIFDSEASLFAIPILGIFFLLVLKLSVMKVNSFEVYKHHFCIHRPLLFSRIQLKWKTIDAIHIKENQSSANINASMYIRTKFKSYKFNYELDRRTHNRLKKALHKRVPTTTYTRIAA